MIGEMVQCSLSEEVDMPSIISAESLEQGSSTLIILTVTIALSLILVLGVLFYRRSTEDDPYADEGVWEDQTRNVVENMHEAKQAPAIPASAIQPMDAPSRTHFDSTTTSVEVDDAIEVAPPSETSVELTHPQDAESAPESALETLESPSGELAWESVDEELATDTGGIEEQELSEIVESKPDEEPLDWGAEW